MEKEKRKENLDCNQFIGIDKFFVEMDTGTLIWMYYNEDAFSGGQFVYNIIDFYDALEAVKNSKSVKDFFIGQLSTIAKQYLYDINDAEFNGIKYNFEHWNPIAIGLTEESMDRIVKNLERWQLRKEKRKMIRFVENNRCPKCGSMNVHWESFMYEHDNSGYIPFKCYDCRTKGNICYQLRVSQIETQDENGIEEIVKN